MATLTTLNANNSNISNLQGLETAVNIQSLGLQGNQISNIIQLANLTNLTQLDLGGNQISDIAPLANLTNLDKLFLHYNQISDLAPLANLSSISYLYLYGNQISDIAPLANIAGLEVLHISSNQISDISPLANLTNVFSLNLGQNQISDISPLANKTNLIYLLLNNNQISDISALASQTNLIYLILFNNQISDITPLASVTRLTELQIQNNQISDVTPLANLNSLDTLYANNNQISDVVPLANLISLRTLVLGSNQIQNLAPLANLSNLNNLFLWNNQINDLAPLANLTSLTDLRLFNNHISNISPLANLPSLRELSLYSNSISDIAPLADRTSLEVLHLGSNEISNIGPLANLTNLKELYLSNNKINDITSLVMNSFSGGLGSGDTVQLQFNYLDLSAGSQDMNDIDTLITRGASVTYFPQNTDIASPTALITNPTEGQMVSGTIDVNALIDDSLTVNSNITEATYSVDWGAPVPMNPSDGFFDSPTENVTAQLDTTTLTNGYHTIAVMGRDAAGNWSIVTTVNIDVYNHINRSPLAYPNGPYETTRGDDLVLDGTGSSDPDEQYGDSIVKYEWDIDSDGMYDATGSNPTIPWSLIEVKVPAGNWDVDSFFDITYRIEDSFGASSQATTTLTIYENRPIASLTANPSPALCEQAVTFDASSSSHTSPQRSIVSYEWDFDNDGIFDYTEAIDSAPDGLFDGKAIYTYERAGSYTATLRVTDNNSPPKTATTTQTVQVNIDNRPPVAAAGGPYIINAGENFVLDASSSTDPNEGCGDSIVAYSWDLDNDGQFDDATGKTPTITPDFFAPGSDPFSGIVSFNGTPFLTGQPYLINLRVTDTFGVRSTSATTLTIYDNRPFASVTATPNAAHCGEPITFDAGASTHGRPDRSIVKYEFDFDYDGTNFASDYTESLSDMPDGLFDGKTIASYTGASQAAVRVTDDNSPPKIDVEIVALSLQSVAPIVVTGGPYTFKVDMVDGEVNFDPFGSTEPDASCGDSIVRYEWDLDGDGVFEAKGEVSPTGTNWSWDLDGDGIYEKDNGQSMFPVDSFFDVFFDQGTNTYRARYVDSFFDVFFEIDLMPPSQLNQAQGKQATLRVTDSTGQTAQSQTTFKLTYDNRPPVTNPNGPYQINEGGNLPLDGSGSTDEDIPYGDSIVAYRWDLDGDGAFDDATGQNPTISWQELVQLLPSSALKGDSFFDVFLEAEDSNGAVSTPQMAQVMVRNVSPTVDGGPDKTVNEGDTVNLNGSFVDPGTLDAHTATIDWGDGSPVENGFVDELMGTVSGSHVYADNGTYTVTVEVYDDDGGSSSDTLIVTVIGPDVDVSPLLYDFGDVELGSSETTIVTVSNLGSADFTLNNLGFMLGGSVDFWISQAPIVPEVISPGETKDIEVTYMPTSLGSFSATLLLETDDPNEGLTLVEFNGNGVWLDLPPQEQIQKILDFFDKSVADGTLTGSGSGNSAPGRLNALINMIEAAGDLIEAGDTEAACDQLRDAHSRTDGQSPPPDFVTGEAASLLATIIQATRANLGCD